MCNRNDNNSSASFYGSTGAKDNRFYTDFAENSKKITPLLTPDGNNRIEVGCQHGRNNAR